MADVLAQLRANPLTAPFIAAFDTAYEVLHGNIRYVLAEPLVVLGSVIAAVQAAGVGGDWKAWVAAFAVAAARWFTEPHRY